jgi:hypothetical protein
MPYYHRFQHLNNTLVSFRHWYKGRDDYQLFVMEDQKNYLDSLEHMNLVSLVDEFEDIPIHHLYYGKEEIYNPCEMFNRMVESVRIHLYDEGIRGTDAWKKAAKEHFLVLTNPECFHTVDILGGLDGYMAEDPEQYVVCSCKSVYNQNTIEHFEDLKYDIEMWYVHGEHYPRKIHFCTCISLENYDKAYGFDHRYIHGIGYEDDDFVRKVQAEDIKITHADELVTLHQAHSRGYGAPDYTELLKKNEAIYKEKWGL